MRAGTGTSRCRRSRSSDIFEDAGLTGTGSRDPALSHIEENGGHYHDGVHSAANADPGVDDSYPARRKSLRSLGAEPDLHQRYGSLLPGPNRRARVIHVYLRRLLGPAEPWSGERFAG